MVEIKFTIYIKPKYIKSKFLCDFIIEDVEIASYANDSTPYSNRKFSNEVLQKLECGSRNIFKWFFNNAIKTNIDKFHFLSSLDMNTKISLSSFDIESTHSQNLLGVTTDCKLNFHDHVSNLCKKSKWENKCHCESLAVYAFK